MYVDPNGRWTSNDDELFDGAIKAESLQGGGHVSQPDGISPHDHFHIFIAARMVTRHHASVIVGSHGRV